MYIVYSLILIKHNQDTRVYYVNVKMKLNESVLKL